LLVVEALVDYHKRVVVALTELVLVLLILVAVAVAVAETKLVALVVLGWQFLSIGAQFNGTLCKNC
jgi:hypothetical protein